MARISWLRTIRDLKAEFETVKAALAAYDELKDMTALQITTKIKNLEEELAAEKAENETLKKLKSSLEQSLSQALNEGDGSYKP